MWTALLLLSLRFILVIAWTTEELAIYDLVEELNGSSFYDFFEIPKDASTSDIKKAYRRLSLEWHPDRSSDEKAEEQFRKIAAVYEVLKSSALREKYDSILANGLPDWKQPVFYYRRARKLSWYEAVVVIIIVCSVGHYFMLWGAYIDKYLTLSSNRNKLRKREIRQLKKAGGDAETMYEAEIAEILSDVWPSWRNSLPVLIVSLLYKIAISFPDFVRGCIDVYHSRTEKLEENNTEDVLPRRYIAAPQPVYEYAVASDLKPVLTCAFNEECDEKPSSENSNAASNKEAWTSEELALLVRLSTEKYPVGTPNRWDLMAKILDRSPQNVAMMVGKLKQMRRDAYAKLLRNSQSSAVVQDAAQITALRPPGQPPNEKLTNSNWDDSRDGKERISDEWSQHDQRLFETALQQFPKGTADRWDKIVNCVPSKTKQQCIERFKYLSEMVRQRKSQHKNKKK